MFKSIDFYLKHGEVIGKGLSDYISQSTPVIENNEIVSNTSSVYPNPFNSFTKINFNLSRRNNVSLIVYDINGREVSKEEFGTLNIGAYSYNLNASKLSSGIYFYRINEESGITLFKGKLVLLK